MGNVETNSTDRVVDAESDAARWKAFLNDPEFLDNLLLGVSKSPPGWWDQAPGEDAVAWMFRVFPVARLQ